MLSLSLHIRVENWLKYMDFCQIRHNVACSKDILMDSHACVILFSRQNSQTFYILQAFLSLIIAAINSQKQYVFCHPPCISADVDGLRDVASLPINIIARHTELDAEYNHLPRNVG